MPAAHHRLLGDVHQLLNVVILVLLKGGEEHVQHHLTLGSHHLPLRLLLPLVRDLKNPNVHTAHECWCLPTDGRVPRRPAPYVEIVVGHGLEDGSDGPLQLLRQTWTLEGLFNLNSETSTLENETGAFSSV